MASNDGGTDGGGSAGTPGGPVPNIADIGGRFKCTHKFVPTRQGMGYWNVCVRDTYTGNEQRSVAYSASDIPTQAEEMAREILSNSRADLDGEDTYRFNIPNQDDAGEGGELDNPVENAMEAGPGDK